MKGFQIPFTPFCFPERSFYWGHGKNEGEVLMVVSPGSFPVVQQLWNGMGTETISKPENCLEIKSFLLWEPHPDTSRHMSHTLQHHPQKTF